MRLRDLRIVSLTFLMLVGLQLSLATAAYADIWDQPELSGARCRDYGSYRRAEIKKGLGLGQPGSSDDYRKPRRPEDE